jgi:hypothetical protein
MVVFISCLSHINTDPEVVRKNHDLTAQLTGRKERLSWLIKFLNDNMVLVKVKLACACARILGINLLTSIDVSTEPPEAGDRCGKIIRKLSTMATA